MALYHKKASYWPKFCFCTYYCETWLWRRFHYEIVMNFLWNPKDSHNNYELNIALWNRTLNSFALHTCTALRIQSRNCFVHRSHLLKNELFLAGSCRGDFKEVRRGKIIWKISVRGTTKMLKSPESSLPKLTNTLLKTF